MNKKGIAMQTTFYIFMAIIFTSMLFFGYQKFMLVTDTLDDQKRIEIMQNLEKSFTYCNDPLNSGSSEKLVISQKRVSIICVNNNHGDSGLDELLEADNVLIFDGNENVLSAFSVNTSVSGCWTGDDSVEITFTC